MRNDRTGAVGQEDARLLWRAGSGGRWDHFSHGWFEFTGRTLEQELDDGWLEGMHPEDIVKFLPVYLDAFSRRVPFEFPVRLLHRDGTWRWVGVHGTPSFAAVETFVGFSGNCAVMEGREGTAPSTTGEGRP